MDCYPFEDSLALLDRRALGLHSVLALFFLIYTLACRTTPVVYEIQFMERDPTISFWVVDSQVPTWLLYLLAAIIPSVYILFIVFFLMRGKSWKLRGLLVLWWGMGLFQTIFLTTALFNTIKVITGKLRPNFFALCNYAGYRDAWNSGNFSAYLNTTSADRIGSISRCLGPTADIEDGRKSFLSGHAAIGFCGMVYTSLLVTSGFHSAAWYYPLRVIAFLAPLYLGAWIGITRIQDKEHFTEDVIAGALLGIFVAYSIWSGIKPQTDKLKSKSEPSDTVVTELT